MHVVHPKKDNDKYTGEIKAYKLMGCSYADMPSSRAYKDKRRKPRSTVKIKNRKEW